MEYDEGWQSKVFVASPSGAWWYRSRETYEIAEKIAIEGCEQAANQKYSKSGKCRALAVGNTIVWDMTESKREDVIAAYIARKGRSAWTNPLPEVLVFHLGRQLVGETLKTQNVGGVSVVFCGHRQPEVNTDDRTGIQAYFDGGA